MPRFLLLFLILLMLGRAYLNLWLKLFWQSRKILGQYFAYERVTPILSLLFFSNIFTQILDIFTMFYMPLTHFTVFFTLFFFLCLRLDILHCPSSNLLIFSFIVSSALTLIYWVLNFNLLYVRISMVKFSVSSSIFLNILSFFLSLCLMIPTSGSPVC